MENLICKDCGKILDMANDLYDIYPPIPISDWDKEHSDDLIALRSKAYICCGKFRMIDLDGTMVAYDINTKIEATKNNVQF